MALWEYKVITSGLHGFASPALMETHLNTLGKDEWEIIHFQTLPNNPLAFNGLARRSTMRDWVPPEVAAVASPPRPSAYEPAPSQAKPAVHIEEKPELPAAIAAEVEPSKLAPGSSLRAFRDTERDQDPQAQDEAEDWDNWEDSQDELPTFFEAIKPMLRRNQKGPGNSVGIDQLARRWEQRESDVVGALKECGLTVPETEEQDPEYFEFEGDLFWVNRNNRGQLFVNSREKPRPAFRIAKATKLPDEDPAAVELVAERTAEKAEIEKQKAERIARQAAADAAREAARLAREKRDAEQAARAAERAAERAAAGGSEPKESAAPIETKVLSGPLPPEAEILEKIRPQMRRNRRGPGYSGSITFLARALSMSEADLTAAFAVLGLNLPENANDKPVYVEIDGAVYWINKDGRGGVWINGREKRDGERQPGANGNGNGEASVPAVPAAEAAPGPASTGPLDQDKPAQEASSPTEPATGSEETAETEKPSEESSATESSQEEPSAVSSGSSLETSGDNPALTAVRLLLKPNKRGSGVSGEVGFLSRTLEKSEEAFLGALTDAGLVVPADSEAKPVFVEQAGEIFWLNKNSTDGSLWLNAKAAKSAAKKPSSASGASRPRSRKPKAEKSDAGE